jgi:CBS domain-containing protein
MASIESFIHQKVVILKEEASVYQAARAMCEHKIGCVVVCDSEGNMVGILTDRDLACTVLSESNHNKNLTLSDVMTSEPVCIDENDSFEKIVELMESCGVRRIPVTHLTQKHTKKCVGIITLDDLIVSKLVNQDQLSRIIETQVTKKENSRLHRLGTMKAKERSEAHIEQTLNHFHKCVSQKTHLSVDLSERMTKFVLESIVGRIHYQGAAHFIAQLPKGLQEDLLDLPAGPNRNITAESLLAGVMRRARCGEPRGRWILCQFFDALGDLIDKKTIEYVWAQLPQDIRLVFGDSLIVKEFKRKPAVA